MGTVKEEITLINSGDVANFRRGFVPESYVRQLTVEAIVDTGAMSLVIDESTRKTLGLAVERDSTVTVAGGERKPCKITEPVIVRWKNRETVCNAVVLSTGTHILLGVIPLEGMDLMVNPVEQKLVGANGDEQVIFVL